MSSKQFENSEGALQSTGDRLLQLLKSRGPQQASVAGGLLGMTSEAARQQFVKLASSGLVVSYSEPRGVGRPVQYWQLTSKGHARFPDTHSELTIQLLESVRQTFGEAAIDKLIDVREQQNLESYRAALSSAQTLAEKLQCLVEVRTREGYMAEYYEEGEGFMFIENHCPICSAATVCQGFCRSELDIFEKVLGAKVERVEHILLEARRCAYRVMFA